MTLTKTMGNQIRQLLLTTTIHGSPLTQVAAVANFQPEFAVARQPIEDDAASLAITMTNILTDVTRTAGKLPYVEGIAGIVSQLLQIRQELQAHSRRCNTLLEKVLRNGKIVFEQWAMLSGHRAEGRLKPLFEQLEAYHGLLEEVHRILQTMKRRSFLDRLFNRGLEELTELDRKIESFGRNVDSIGITQILSEMNKQRQLPQIAGGTPFIGPAALLPPGPVCVLERDDQRETIVISLLSSTNARVAVLGMGGIGKTTLACCALRDPRVIKAYPRRLFISFEGLSTSELVYNSLANTFNISTESRKSNAQVLEQVKHYLEQEKTVICVDNFETFWEVPKNRRDADDFIGQLALLPSLAIIATLRGIQEPGNIAWVRVGPLPPLTQTASDGLVRKIVQGALGDNDSDVLQKLLEAVAGVPLAVTLVGNLLRDGSETPQSLWHRWSQESTRAIGMDVDDRQYQLDVSLWLSVYGPRVSDDSRAVLAAISVLPGGLSSEGAWLDEYQSLLSPSINIYNCIRALCNTALCSLDKTTSPPRYQLLSPVRRFCMQHLPLDLPSIRRLIDLYISRQRGTTNLTSSSEYAWFTNELTNITSILNFALDLPYITDSLAYACSTYTRWMIYLGLPTTDIIYKATNAQPEGSRARAKCLQSLAYTLRRLDVNEEAIDLLWEAFYIHKEAGHRHGEAWDMMELGTAYRELGRFGDAEEAIHYALTLYREQGHLVGAANTLNSLAQLSNDMDNFSEAESYAKLAIELYCSEGSQVGKANALNTLGLAYRRQGKLELAAEASEEAYRISTEIKYTHGKALAKCYIGLAHVDGGRLGQAYSCLRESMRLFEKCSNHTAALLVISDLEQVLSKLQAMSEREAVSALSFV